MEIKYSSRDLPGLHQIQQGHFEAYDWSETARVGNENWCYLVKDGHGIKISFIMGTWHGFSRKKCLRCFKPRKQIAPSRWHQTCSSCGLDLRYVEPDAFPYEPQDIIIGMGHDTYRDYCLESRSGNSRDPRKKYNCDTQHKAARYSSKRRFKDSEIPVDLVCRRITLKWEPIFNMTYRYLHCRCVVRPSTPSRLQEEMTFFVCFPCPRHNDRGVSFLDYGNIDYHQDPYFDRFGGYDCFRAMIRLYGENIYTILGGTKFLGQEEADAAIDALIELDETHQGAVRSFLREYWFEVNEHLQSSGYDLPKEVVQYLEQEKLKRNKEESELSERMSRVRLPRRDASEIPMSREVLEILDGKWSGRPHWAVDRQRGEGIGH